MHTDYLEHHGILGQKWGVRRYQNPDGSLTSAGKKRYLGERTDDMMIESARKRVEKAKANVESFEPIRKNGAYNKNGQQVMTPEDVERARDKSVKKQQKAEKNLAIQEKTKELQEETSPLERAIFNRNVRQLAAHYVVNKNMSMEDARKKANRQAAAYVASLLAVEVALNWSDLKYAFG